MGTTRRWAAALAAVVLGSLLAACGDSSGGGSGSSGGAMTIRLAVNTNATVLPAWVAQEQGFFKNNGLDVSITNVDNIATLPPALGKSFDVALSTPTLLISASAQRIPAVWVSGSSVNDSSDTNTLLLAGKDSGITDVSDLAGKTIGVLNETGTVHIATLKWLQDEGVDPASVTVVQVNAPAMADQLQSGRVDAVEAIHPYTQGMLSAGAVDLGKPYAHLADTISGIMYIAQPDWASSHGDALAAFVTSLQQGQDYITSNDADARKILQKYTQLPDDVVAGTDLPHFDTAVREQDLQVWLDAMKEVSGFGGSPDLGSLVYSG